MPLEIAKNQSQQESNYRGNNTEIDHQNRMVDSFNLPNTNILASIEAQGSEGSQQTVDILAGVDDGVPKSRDGSLAVKQIPTTVRTTVTDCRQITKCYEVEEDVSRSHDPSEDEVESKFFGSQEVLPGRDTLGQRDDEQRHESVEGQLARVQILHVLDQHGHDGVEDSGQHSQEEALEEEEPARRQDFILVGLDGFSAMGLQLKSLASAGHLVGWMEKELPRTIEINPLKRNQNLPMNLPSRTKYIIKKKKKKKNLQPQHERLVPTEA
ncbi:hypothetical protein CEXT_187831 [Caerostris extrusa]|uniref:Uncharacterized protein n=1 Tax=Caerostris extrusa TaxID=172846 RepID=A0AAV4MLJ3_CAEEX|nr:hypothetical protein CEXT_187831 [Caerostris extrusa]